MALRSRENYSITMKSMALFRPKLSNFFSTNQIARFVNYYCDGVKVIEFSIRLKNRPFSYSTKEPGSSDIFIQFYSQGSIEWRWSFDHNCAHSKILQIVMKYRSIHILFQNS